MTLTPPPTISAARSIVVASALAIATSLSGCAMLPDVGQPGMMKAPAEYESAASFSAPAANWPAERWWQSYGDAQLVTLIDEALRDAPDMAAAAARMRRAEAYLKVSGSTLLPQVSANASVAEQKLSYNYLTPGTMTPGGWQDYGIGTINLNWEIDFWGKNRAAVSAATSQREASRAEAALVQLNLAAAIAINYADLAKLHALRDTAVRTVEIRSKTVELFNERFQNGMETQGSVSEAKARLAGAQGELLSIEEQIGLTCNRLASLAGAGPDRALSIKRPKVDLGGHFGLPPELAVNLLGRRPDVIMARLLAEAQSHRIAQKKAEFYPNVNLSAFIGVQSLGLNNLTKAGSDIGGIGPAVSLPLFTAGRLQGELRATSAAYDEMVANYNATVTHALEEVAGAALSIKALARQVEKAEEAVREAAEAHRVARDRYEGGLANFIEVLYAEDVLLNNQRSLTALKSRALTLDITLQRALGGGYQFKNS
ncbi:efflux transporter outer membrane subunit [Geomonas subterranea]|uniref:Efflux transporter outer membrane subunit n=1 Tax=Geomonas subterranea TaxID=2847989 RepID=A0ABX8LL77_9BACT|nr:efflux transporter outer membrane subunit [Geomonas subterranea]QXE91632.1 efflux transporter outer membrane subunit [Geomonas subterranea]QXM10276.1 efflux transporter outer membrane subunit [Geomonas subterranea]